MDERNEDDGEMPEVPASIQKVKIEAAIAQVKTQDVIRTTRPRSSEGQKQEQAKILDWTRHEVPNASGFVRFLRNFDWSKTPLGSMNDWPTSLRLHFTSIAAHPQPRGLLWGHEQILLYNEACIPMIGKKHPQAMGQHVSTFGDFFEKAAPAIKSALEDGRVTSVTNFPITMDRHEELPHEESFWSFDLVPLCGEKGTADGVLNTLTETTSVVVAERRIATVLDIARETTRYESISDIWQGIVSALKKNVEDIPFALLYAVTHGSDENDDKNENGSEKDGGRGDGKNDGDGDEDTNASTTGDENEEIDFTDCRRVGTVGFDEDDEQIPREFSIRDPERSQGLAHIFKNLAKNRSTKLLDGAKDELPAWLQRGVEGRAGGWPTQRVLALPIPPMTGSGLLGFLMIGLSVRRPYDADYKLFVKLLSDRLLSTTAQVQMPKSERDAQNAAEEAALRHASLSRQLALKAQEAQRHEAKVTRLAQQAPVAMINLSVKDLTMVEANDKYYELTGVAYGDEQNWGPLIHEDDMPAITVHLAECQKAAKTTTFQYRLKRPWSSIDSKTGVTMHGETWISCLLFPEIEDGEVIRIAAWLTDISLQKWTEEAQTRKLEEALELKRQRENFIDMTSHEMRNPLSAILQSSDGILESLREFPRKTNGDVTLSAEAVESILDAAKTINLCGQHQKSIVDDILTISKLDSRLMLLAPERVRPRNLVEDALKMYRAEIEKAGINTAIVVDESYENLEVDEVVLDPSRLLQVLVNLLTNAIKFTRNEERETGKRIKIILSASSERPDTDPLHKIKFIPVREQATDPHAVSDLRRRMSTLSEGSTEEVVYLLFAVEDTGRGLTEAELNMLFMRFSQASAKTYGTYGGSGLGLFISRELTELQGGQIGVSSTAGVGSTFSFYVKAMQVTTISRRSSNVSTTPSPSHATESKSDTKEVLSTYQPQVHRRPTTATTITSTADDNVAKPEKQSLKRKLHVLLTEDNIINQRVIATQLRRLGNTVHVANHGLEALQFLQRTTFAAGCSQSSSLPSSPTKEENDESSIPLDIMLLDQEMPVLDGLGTIKKVREWQNAGHLNGHLPVIAVTANARAEQKDELVRCGVDDVLTKPFSITDLVQQMETLLEGLEVEIPGE